MLAAMNTANAKQWLQSNTLKKLWYLLLAILVCWLLIKIVMMLLAPPVFNDKPMQVKQAVVARNSWNWFASSAPVVTEQVSKSRINAQLVGVMIVGDRAVASISTPKKKNGVYTVGDDLQRGVSVHSIEENRVLLDENGQLRELPLKTVLQQGISKEQVKATGRSSRGSAGSTGLANMVSIAPAKTANNKTGMALQRIDEDLQAMGDLREGDVIVSVGAVAVSELMSNPLKLQRFMSQSSVPVQIERDGQSQEVYVNVAAVAEKLLPQMGSGMFK